MDKKNSDALGFTIDPNDIFIINSSPSLTIYSPKEHLKELCWVRALTKLAQIYEDPNVTDAWMTAGWLNRGWGEGGHAWIEYRLRDSNGTIRYDPKLDVYLEPHPNDANLLIPVIPKEPRKALEIIYDSNEWAIVKAEEKWPD